MKKKSLGTAAGLVDEVAGPGSVSLTEHISEDASATIICGVFSEVMTGIEMDRKAQRKGKGQRRRVQLENTLSALVIYPQIQVRAGRCAPTLPRSSLVTGERPHFEAKISLGEKLYPGSMGLPPLSGARVPAGVRRSEP